MTEEGAGFFQDSYNPKETSKMSGEKPSSCTPLTIRQLLGNKKTNERFHVDGKELDIVEILGQVVAISKKSTYTSFTVDDCTASMEIKIFDSSLKNNEFLAKERENIREGDFVKFFGHISEWKERFSLNAIMARVVTDANEIYFHMLECIQVHLFNTQGPPPSVTGSSRGDDMNTSMMGNDAYNFGANPSSSGQNDVAVARLEQAMDEILTAASQVITPQKKRTGVLKSEILDLLYGQYPEDQLEAAFDNLVQSGKLFNTLDDEHFTIN
ncbi:hypothetical protein C9374_007440 [Naegleria lovaniensis]|uniref:Replication protein A C-terminal domain-containing protein n=1 Tax=Naegleria lovaniensis TaxID=51637 RepID=A0AA88KIL0_NAELO|nr:uncharacterized protein C9374_007440 [Naegleria lovaniensis]KAG2379301.1 hypothetical protein C9374_007440 [Naegleria lovaniensis]